MDEITVDEALQACLNNPQGRIVAQWLAESAFDNYPLTVSGQNGTDPIFAAFRDGGAALAREILDRAGYRITFERKPDERRSDDDRDDGTDTGLGR